LDKQINDFTQAVVNGSIINVEEVKMFCEKVILRHNLDTELQQLREGQ
jgi:hypothetical protein